jgi:hypothetical protein
MNPVGKATLCLMMLVAVGGCAGKKTTIHSGFRIQSYELVNEETTIDSEGNHVRIYHWRYEDGVTTTTQEYLLHGQNEIRRNEPLPHPGDRLTD